MKKGTPRHPKTKRLAKALKIKQFSAVGLLELLWHYTAEFHPAGDIGRSADPDIAEALFWDKEPSVLIVALTASGWLDKVEDKTRLLVHDWHVHAEDGVHLKLARGKKYFANGEAPRYTRLGPKDRAVADAFFEGSKAHVKRTSSAFPIGEGLRGGQGMASYVLEVNTKTEKQTTRAREALQPDLLGLVGDLEVLYNQAGVPVPERHKQQITQMLVGIEPGKLNRIPAYVRWALQSGKWPNAAKTKTLLNLLRDGDWDVEITERTIQATGDKPGHTNPGLLVD